MNDQRSPNWNEEYKAFLESPRIAPPQRLSSQFKMSVSRQLNPSYRVVFAKLFAIHLVAGALTLFLCPQFGVADHSKQGLLFQSFLLLGEYGCMLACGALFLGTTALAAVLCLGAPEARAIRNSSGLQWGLLALLSVGFFLSFREQEASIPTGLVIIWVFGALLGGVSVFQLGYAFRIYLRSRLASAPE